MSLEFSDSPLSATPGGWPIAMLCLCRLIKQMARVLCEAINNMSHSGLLAQIELLALLTFSTLAYLNHCHNLTRLLPSVPIMLNAPSGMSFENTHLNTSSRDPLFILLLTSKQKKATTKNSVSQLPASTLVCLLLCFILTGVLKPTS